MSGSAVCLATSATQPGGVWRHLRELGEACVARGIAVRVALPASATTLRAEAVRHGFAVGPQRLADEVFHAHLADTYDKAMTAAISRARASGSPVVVTEHLPRSDASDPRLADRTPRPGARQAKTALKRLQLGLVDQVIAVSTGSAAFLAERYGLAPTKLATVFNGVPVEAADEAPRPAPVRGALRLAATGAIIQQKGFDLLVHAGEHARTDWRVAVYGTGPHLARYRAAAAGLRLADGAPRISFEGWTDDVRARVRAADALVMPSRWEAMPYSALEAMSWSRPVLGTAVDGLSDLVEPGVTGLLVPPEPRALAAALDDFCADPSAALAMGRAGRLRVAQRFTLDAMVEGTLEVYARASRRVRAGSAVTSRSRRA